MNQSIENQLLDWEDVDDCGLMRLSFQNVTLKVQIGKFPAGTKFSSAFFDGERSVLQLYNSDEEYFEFDLKISAVERV